MAYQFNDYISLLIKPTDACNLRCVYCFHRDTIGYEPGLMSMDTLERIYQATFPYYKSVRIVWHGGEPTCAGIDFYKDALKLQKSFANKYNVTVKNSIQTNGTLLTQEFIDLFKSYDVTIGVSYDGIVNDITRNDTSAVNESRTLLNKNGTDPGIITVITKLNVDHLIENYEVMKTEKRNYQMNHYVETNRENPDTRLCMDFNNFAKRVTDLFNYWVNDEECYIDVQPFCQLFYEILLGFPTVCIRSSCHKNWMCIDHTGKITPCDKQFPEDYTYGNIHDLSDIREIYESDGFKNLLKAAVERRRKCANECEYYGYCLGGCSHSATVECGTSENNGFSCKTQKLLIGLTLGYLKENQITKENFESKMKNPHLIKILKKGMKCVKT